MERRYDEVKVASYPIFDGQNVTWIAVTKKDLQVIDLKVSDRLLSNVEKTACYLHRRQTEKYKY